MGVLRIDATHPYLQFAHEISGEAEILPCAVPGTDQAHNVVRIRKRRETPEKYPRRWAKIQKQPL